MGQRKIMVMSRYVFLSLVLIAGILAIIGSGPSTQYQRTNVEPAAPAIGINSQDIAKEISKDKSSYTQDYILGAVGVVGECEKFLNTPKYMVNSVASDVKVAYRTLKIKYPKYSGSVLNKYLSELTSKVTRISDNVKYVDQQDTKLVRKDYRGALQRLDEIGVLSEEISILSNGINSGLGL